MYNGKPVVAICGPGESGKDHAAMTMRNLFPVLVYKGSTSAFVKDKIFDQVKEGMWHDDYAKKPPAEFKQMRKSYIDINPEEYETANQFHAARREYRRFWADWIDCYNHSDETGARLYIDAIEGGSNFLTGIRRKSEIEAVKETKLVDLFIWILRPFVKHDMTLNYGPEQCDICIINPVPYGEPNTPENCIKFDEKIKQAFFSVKSFLTDQVTSTSNIHW